MGGWAPHEVLGLPGPDPRDSEGLLIASASSMGVVRKVFDRRSPLLGVFGAFKVDLASMADTIV